MDTLYCYLLQVRVSTFLRASFRMGEQERLHKGPGGEVRDAKDKYSAYHSSLESP